jgi:hypothetical protein
MGDFKVGGHPQYPRQEESCTSVHVDWSKSTLVTPYIAKTCSVPFWEGAHERALLFVIVCMEDIFDYCVD